MIIATGDCCTGVCYKGFPEGGGRVSYQLSSSKIWFANTGNVQVTFIKIFWISIIMCGHVWTIKYVWTIINYMLIWIQAKCGPLSL